MKPKRKDAFLSRLAFEEFNIAPPTIYRLEIERQIGRGGPTRGVKTVSYYPSLADAQSAWARYREGAVLLSIEAFDRRELKLDDKEWFG